VFARKAVVRKAVVSNHSHLEPREASGVLGPRKRKILSPVFVLLVAFVGAAGFATTAYAYGSTQAGPTIYYGQTGPDGVIHCAGYEAQLNVHARPPTSDGDIYDFSTTYVAKDLYCVNADSYPANYFFTSAVVSQADGPFCFQTAWAGNPSGASSIETYGVTDHTSCSAGPENAYQGWGFSKAAVNLSWQYGTLDTNLVSS
jgi:hypothetical protein